MNSRDAFQPELTYEQHHRRMKKTPLFFLSLQKKLFPINSLNCNQEINRIFYFLYHWFINDSTMTFAELSQCSWILCSHCLDKIEGAEPAAFDPTLESPLSGWGQSQRMSQSHLPASRFRKYWCIWVEILSKRELSCFCKIHLSI